MKDSTTSSKPWLEDIKDAEKAFHDYDESSTNIEKLYGNLKQLAQARGDREFKIFWANVELLRPAVYQRAPRPVVMPRHSDLKEIVRKSSEMMERALEFDIEFDELHETLLEVRDDLVLCGRGVPWVLDDGSCIHVNRCDFLHEPARKWKEVGWVARAAYLTREQGVARFGDRFFDVKIEEHVGQEREDEYKSTEKKVKVWEIWSRTKESVVWVTEGYDDVLDEQPPLIDVKGFFPCPKPAYATIERGTLKPIPDFAYYRDQIDEINELTARISGLAESLRLKGFYASGDADISDALESAMRATDNKAILVPVAALSAFGAQKVADSIVWLPVADVAQVIASCIELRKQLIEDVYEITGLSDVMRGVTEAQETLGAQNLKAQYGSIRVREKQNEMVRVALDVLRMKAEILAEGVPAAQIAEMAGMTFPTRMQIEQQMANVKRLRPDAPMPPMPITIEQIDEFLKTDRVRSFAMEVETDSTIAPNEEAEKQSRVEFLTAVTSFISTASEVVTVQPAAAPFMAELLKFGVGAFRAGRDLGGAIDEFAEQAKQLSQSAGEDKPDPEVIKAMTERETKMAEIQLKQNDQAIRQQEMQIKAADSQALAQVREFDAKAKMAMKQYELSLKAQDLGIKQDAQRLEAQRAEIQALLDVEELQMEREQRRPVLIGDA